MELSVLHANRPCHRNRNRNRDRDCDGKGEMECVELCLPAGEEFGDERPLVPMLRVRAHNGAVLGLGEGQAGEGGVELVAPPERRMNAGGAQSFRLGVS